MVKHWTGKAKSSRWSAWSKTWSSETSSNRRVRACVGKNKAACCRPWFIFELPCTLIHDFTFPFSHCKVSAQSRIHNMFYRQGRCTQRHKVAVMLVVIKHLTQRQECCLEMHCCTASLYQLPNATLCIELKARQRPRSSATPVSKCTGWCSPVSVMRRRCLPVSNGRES